MSAAPDAPVTPFRQRPFATLPERPTPPHPFFAHPHRRVRVASRVFGDVEIAFQDVGRGPPLLLVHGLMTTSYSWRYMLSLLADRYRLIVPDLPGAGRSDKPLAVRYSPEAFAVFIAEFQRAVGIRGCECVGNSIAGWLCMLTALEDPGAFRRLLNVHSPGWPLWRIDALRALLGVPGARRLLAAIVRRDPLRWAHRNVHYRDESRKSLEEAREYGEPLAATAGRTAFVKFLAETLDPAAMRRFTATLADRRERGEAFPVPLTLAYARRDPMVPPRVGRRLAELLPSARMVWLDDASHFAHVDVPERVAALIDETFGLPVAGGGVSRNAPAC